MSALLVGIGGTYRSSLKFNHAEGLQGLQVLGFMLIIIKISGKHIADSRKFYIFASALLNLWLNYGQSTSYSYYEGG